MTKLEYIPFKELYIHEKGFGKHYETFIVPELAELEKERKKSKSETGGILALLGAVWCLAILFTQLTSMDSESSGQLLVFLIIVSIAFLVAFQPTYTTNYKTRIMPKILNFFGNFAYSAEGNGNSLIPLKQYNIFPTYQNASVEDDIKGNYKNVEIEIKEVLLTSKTHKSRRIDFDGLVISLGFPKAFKGQTIIQYNYMKLGLWLGSKLFGNLQRVRLEDPVFEEIFEVYSTDQIESRYLLTTAFLERILELNKVFEGGLQLEFLNNKLLILLNTNGKNLFEPASLTQSAFEIEDIRKALFEIYNVLNIIDILKLNKNIGL